MQEQHTLARPQAAFTRQAHQPGHDLAGVDRVQQQPFAARQQLHRFHHACVGHRVLGLPVAAHANHLVTRHRHAQAQQVTHRLCFFVHQRFLVGWVAADADAGDGNGDAVAQKPGQQTTVRARTARTDDDMVKAQALLEHLLLQFLCAGHITQPTQRVAATAGDDVALATGRGQLIGHGLHGRTHVGAGRHHGQRFHAHQPEHEVVAAGVFVVTAGHALFNDEAAAQAFFGRRRQCDATVVALRRATSHQRVGALGQRVSHEEFELAGFVAAWEQAQQVVALDPYLRAFTTGAGGGQFSAEARHGFQRCVVGGVAAAGET